MTLRKTFISIDGGRHVLLTALIPVHRRRPLSGRIPDINSGVIGQNSPKTGNRVGVILPKWGVILSKTVKNHIAHLPDNLSK